MKTKRSLFAAIAACFMVLSPPAAAERLSVAAASDLRYALDDIVALYRETHPGPIPTVIYGSSGKMTTQIIHGAPYDLFFSADIAFPQRLQAAGLAATEPAVYAIGRIVIWSNTLDASELRLPDLATDPRVRRVAIAQPAHAPYGRRAREALQATGVWDAVQPRLVFGENIAHAAQMVESGAANVGIIALSLARFPGLADHPFHLIDDDLHQPLTQGYVITERGRDNEAAWSLVRFMETDAVHRTMERYGFVIPR
ncbi:MAG: molybdate ABC transporter substrate-binding protein [Thioalkalivibrio sp.]|nr:molybdate ABC transporter substrate-binding protein [Thioalkalivibrio sp.]